MAGIGSGISAEITAPVQRRHIRSLLLLLLRKMEQIIRYQISPMTLQLLSNLQS